MENKQIKRIHNSAPVRNKKRSASSGSGRLPVVGMPSRLPTLPFGLHAVRTLTVINVKKKDKRPLPWAMITVAFMMTILFMFVIMNYAEVDKYRGEIKDLDVKIATMLKTQDTLEAQLSNKYDLQDIKEYAENTLGMVPKKEVRSYRITVKQEDRVEVHNYDDGNESGAGFLLIGLSEIFRDFFQQGE